MHISENIDGSVLRIVEIELKPAGVTKPFKISALDPVTVDPKHYHLEFENDKVRVSRGKFGPHEHGTIHEHLHDRVVVYLLDKDDNVTTPDGKSHALKAPADCLWWTGYAKHSDTTNDAPVEMVIVELKAR
jgi:hypothetical protein